MFFYSVSAVFLYEPVSKEKIKYDVEETTYIVSALSSDEAEEKGRSHAMSEAVVFDKEPTTWNNQMVIKKFIDINKVTEVYPVEKGRCIAKKGSVLDCAEVTFSLYEIDKIINCEPVTLIYKGTTVNSP